MQVRVQVAVDMGERQPGHRNAASCASTSRASWARPRAGTAPTRRKPPAPACPESGPRVSQA
jgi:hypothetical protein